MSLHHIIRASILLLLIPVFGTIDQSIQAQSDTPISCPGAPATRLAVGMTGYISITPPGQVRRAVRIHSDPSASASVLFTMTDGQPFSVVGGPACADNYTFWQIKADSGTGWGAEGDMTSYYLDAVTPTPTPIIPTLAPIEDRILRGHTGPAIDVAWSPDGKTLASASSDGTIRLWDGTTGKTLHVFAGVEQMNDNIALTWSPDGRQIASIGDDARLWLWDVNGGERLRAFGELSNSGMVALSPSVAWSPDGRTLALIATDDQLSEAVGEVWDAASGKLVRILGGSQTPVPLNSVAWSPDGTVLATGGVGAVILWDAATGNKLATFSEAQNPKQYVNAVSWSHDGKLLAWGDNDERRVKIWDVSAAKEVYSFEDATASISGLAWSPSGKTLAVAYQGGDLFFQNVASGSFSYSQAFSDTNRIAWSPDGKTLAQGADSDPSQTDHSVLLWDVSSIP